MRGNEHWSRHPLTLTLVGFILTSIVGGALSQCYEKARLNTENQLQLQADRKKALVSFTRLVYERRTRSAMLVSALRANRPFNEVADKKRLYDGTFVEWNTSLQANLWQIRDMVSAADYSVFENDVESLLVERLKAVDICVSDAYDRYLQKHNVTASFIQCKMDALLQSTLDCGYAITNELYKLLAANATIDSRKATEANRAITRSCGSE
jgi:hypothetical protein